MFGKKMKYLLFAAIIIFEAVAMYQIYKNAPLIDDEDEKQVP